MTSKPTQGEWYVTEGGAVRSNHRYAERNTHTVVCDAIPDRDMPRDERIVNAYLISAAKDMYAGMVDYRDFLTDAIKCAYIARDLIDDSLSEMGFSEDESAEHMDYISKEKEIKEMQEKLARVNAAIDKADGK